MVAIEKHIESKKRTVRIDWTFLVTAISSLIAAIVFIAIYIINIDKTLQLIETHYKRELDNNTESLKAILKNESEQNINIQKLTDQLKYHTHSGGVER